MQPYALSFNPAGGFRAIEMSKRSLCSKYIAAIEIETGCQSRLDYDGSVQH
jgi:hypothetical protein